MIYALLAEKPSHPTVEAVHEAVVAAMPTVSLRTVYQALHDLEAMDKIRLVRVGNGPFGCIRGPNDTLTSAGRTAGGYTTSTST